MQWLLLFSPTLFTAAQWAVFFPALQIAILLWAIYITTLYLFNVRPNYGGKVWYDEDSNTFYYIATDGTIIQRPALEDVIAEASSRTVGSGRNVRIDISKTKPKEMQKTEK